MHSTAVQQCTAVPNGFSSQHPPESFAMATAAGVPKSDWSLPTRPGLQIEDVSVLCRAYPLLLHRRVGGICRVCIQQAVTISRSLLASRFRLRMKE